VPNLLGQSYHAAAINLGHRGLEIGNVVTVHFPGAPPQIVMAQNPRPDSNDVSSPRVDLVLSAPDNGQQFVMPNFVGQPLPKAAKAVEAAGFELGKLPAEAYSSDGHFLTVPVARQYPAAGEKVTTGTKIYFGLKREAEKAGSGQLQK
jgi:beta-lactam-binding protein with PASTA domain